MSVRAQLAHVMPGRVRVRLPDFRGKAEALAVLEQQLVQSALFERVRANPATGSLVLEFKGSQQATLARLAEQFPIELEPDKPTAARRPAGPLADPLRLVSGRDVNPMLLAATLFSGIGMVQLFRGEIMLPALSAFWYAANAFRFAQQPAGADAAAAGS